MLDSNTGEPWDHKPGTSRTTIYSRPKSHTYIYGYTGINSMKYVPGINIYVHILLSPDAERPPSRLLARSGARYEISDLREIYGVGRRNSADSSGRCSSGGGPESAPFSRRVRGTLALRSSLETRGVSSSGAIYIIYMGPPRTKRVWVVASVARSGSGKSTGFFFCSGGPESVCAS